MQTCCSLLENLTEQTLSMLFYEHMRKERFKKGEKIVEQARRSRYNKNHYDYFKPQMNAVLIYLTKKHSKIVEERDLNML
jgi:hypothetical protein